MLQARSNRKPYDTDGKRSDGTNMRHKKSSNNEYKKKILLRPKKHHLCKLFTFCMPDGFVVNVLGPNEGTVNDETIFESALQ